MDEFVQIIEFSQRLNLMSADYVLGQIKDFNRGRISDVRGAEETIREVMGRGVTSAAERERKSFQSAEDLLYRRLSQQRKEFDKSSDAEASFLDEKQGVHTNLMRELAEEEDALSKIRIDGAAFHVDAMNEREEFLGKERQHRADEERAAREKSPFARLQEVIGRVFKELGLPEIPSTLTGALDVVTGQYSYWLEMLRTSFDVAAVGGWKTEDIKGFMVQLSLQKGLYPSLAEEIETTAFVLRAGLPGLSDGAFLELVDDVRRASFMFGTSMETLSSDIAEASRLTNRGADDVIGAFMTLRDIVTKGSDADLGGVASNLENLRGILMDVLREGARYGVTLEEGVFLVSRFSNELDRGIVSVDQLIQFATGIATADLGKKAFLGLEITQRMEGRSEYKELLDVLRPLGTDPYGMERLMETVLTNSQQLAAEEFGLSPEELQNIREQLVAASRETVAAISKDQDPKDASEDIFIQETLLSMLGVPLTGSTPDQALIAREMRLQSQKIGGGFGRMQEIGLDTQMMRQENVLSQIAGLTRTALLRLDNSIHSALAFTGISAQPVGAIPITGQTRPQPKGLGSLAGQQKGWDIGLSEPAVQGGSAAAEGKRGSRVVIEIDNADVDALGDGNAIVSSFVAGGSDRVREEFAQK